MERLGWPLEKQPPRSLLVYRANLSLWDSIGPVGPTGKGNGSCILFVFEYSAAFFDVVRPTVSTPSGPMTRARVKAIHDKVNSLLSMCDLDTPLNGLLLHSDTPIPCLCSAMVDLTTPMKISKEVMKMAKKYDKKRKKQKTHAAVLPPPPAVLPLAPGPVVPLEIPPKLPARPKMLLYPTVLAGCRPRTTASIEDN